MKALRGALAAVSLAGAHVSCSAGAPAELQDERPIFVVRPGDPTAADQADAGASPPAVGPAPLRRLSDSEYLNALADTFPGLSPTLPALPADIAGAGFDNDVASQQPSDVLIARYEAIANLYAQAATATPAAVSALVGCADWSTAALATSCATAFVQSTGSRLFRRPITADEQSRFILRFQGWQAAVDFEAAVQLTLSAMLQSPQFIYRPEPLSPALTPGTIVAVEPYAMASRLSFLLWASVPDDVLLAAASRGELATEEQLGAQAARMLADDRARRVFWSFTRQWLGLDRILLAENATRTPQVDPAWTAATQVAASQETELFVENLLMEGGSLRALLTSGRAWVNGEMARIYGLASPADPTAWTEVALPKTERAGLLTRASFLAGFSHAGATSPPVRGNGIELRFLCELPLSPPPGVDLSQPMAAPDAGPETNRMLFEERTAPPACQTCHAGLNGFGFGLESYNAAGHYQTTDNGLPVDATGAIVGTDVDGPFNGGVDLSHILSQSRTVHDCATQRMVLYALGRSPVDVEAPWVVSLADSFMQNEGDVRGLLMSIATSPTFRLRQVEEN
jgi:hypothetical protein